MAITSISAIPLIKLRTIVATVAKSGSGLTNTSTVKPQC